MEISAHGAEALPEVLGSMRSPHQISSMPTIAPILATENIDKRWREFTLIKKRLKS
jgi:hypothetical protein